MDWITMSLEARNLAYNNVEHVGPENARKKTEGWAAASQTLREQRAALSNAMHNIFGEWLASCANACTLIATSTIARKVNVTIVRPLMGILGLPLTLCVAAHGCTLIKAYAIAPAASPCWPQSGVPHVW
jgi:hypothetical protein